MSLQTVIFYGKSGSGKGTQAKLLKEFLEKRDNEHRVLYIETGAAFRDFAKKDNFTAQLVKKSLDSGSLLPEFLPVWIWTQFFVDNVRENEHILLDGLARRPDEVPILAKALEFYERAQPQIIFLQLTDEEATERLLGRGRSDDDMAEIKKRLTWFNENVIPAVHAWRNFPEVVVHEISSTPPIEEVHQSVLKTLQLS
jgi:adenylate kinase family enzyme